ncbi:WXG100 family type VII secretion target [Xylanimonas sp. McL0601]|uniref:WXG100 family type VII secretion target n=1 Tax=Xylanimonas sp. McL0601 TaxID=3414739 RepID=UPI003CF1C8FC
MSGKLGMEVSEVRLLAKSLQNDAEQLTSIMQQVTSQLNGTFWKGADAERFRSDWQGHHRADLKTVAAALDEFGAKAKSNADEQEKASN